MSDDGCGMDREALAHIFEPFYTTKGVGEGTGLGLAMIYGAVRQNDGFIHVDSEPGKGTTFEIFLPRHVSAPNHMQADDAAQQPTGGKETILLVEDEPAVLVMTQKMLKKKGYTVLTAAAPSEAICLAKAHAGPIHLLMTDIIMPEMNGRELWRQVSALRPATKCLFMSGYAANVIANRGLLEENANFFQKPFLLKDLAVKVRETLDGKP